MLSSLTVGLCRWSQALRSGDELPAESLTLFRVARGLCLVMRLRSEVAIVAKRVNAGLLK